MCTRVRTGVGHGVPAAPRRLAWRRWPGGAGANLRWTSAPTWSMPWHTTTSWCPRRRSRYRSLTFSFANPRPSPGRRDPVSAATTGRHLVRKPKQARGKVKTRSLSSGDRPGLVFARRTLTRFSARSAAICFNAINTRAPLCDHKQVWWRGSNKPSVFFTTGRCGACIINVRFGPDGGRRRPTLDKTK